MATLIYPLNPDPKNWLREIFKCSLLPRTSDIMGCNVLIHVSEKEITLNTVYKP